MRIREERPEDAAAIRRVTDAAFAPTPRSPEVEARIAEALGTAGLPADPHVKPGRAEADIIDALREAGALSVSLVVEDIDIVAHVAFSPVRIDGKTGRWYGLGPVSVLPVRQRQGIGQKLIRDGLARLKTMGAEGCVLLGYPAYYARFGFVSDPALTYGGAPNPFFQRLVLKGDPPKGDVAFDAAFGQA